MVLRFPPLQPPPAAWADSREKKSRPRAGLFSPTLPPHCVPWGPSLAAASWTVMYEVCKQAGQGSLLDPSACPFEEWGVGGFATLLSSGEDGGSVQASSGGVCMGGGVSGHAEGAAQVCESLGTFLGAHQSSLPACLVSHHDSAGIYGWFSRPSRWCEHTASECMCPCFGLRVWGPFCCLGPSIPFYLRLPA